MSFKYLDPFVEEYHAQFDNEEFFDDSVSGVIKQVQKELLDEKFNPSIQLKTLFDKLLRRSNYPMEVAIVGQFSSGKSTFLNALLSKDVLPTGITPVTSKVNFINYADEYKLKVTYKNGADEYHALDNISKFTDQREKVEDIKYLTLYAPMDILKDISFVDTPGLNSQSHSDTEVTKKILRDVDGIIWLTLIDNAGKESESQVLEEYLTNFEGKSLCVLNQKDKFEKEDITKTVNYISERFNKYFSKVVPISAKLALDSRVNQKDVLIQSATFDLQQQFKDAIVENSDAKNMDFFHEQFLAFKDDVKKINYHDNSNDIAMMKDSNISTVLDFIETDIRPQALNAKAFAIKKDLRSICDILTSEYQTILGVYESLEDILRHKEDEVLKAFDEVYIKHSKSLFITYDKLDTLFQNVADVIFQNIKPKTKVYYTEQKNLFSKINYHKDNYEGLEVQKEAILQELFYENQYVDKQVKAIFSHFKSVDMQSSEDFRDVFRIIKHAVQEWQIPYELIKKHREIASDLEFANIRQYVSKVYEHTLLEYHRSILGNISGLHNKYSFLKGAITFNYAQVIGKSIATIEAKVLKQSQMYESDSIKFSISIPSKAAILDEVKKDFTFEKIELFLTSRRNYLYKLVEQSKEQFIQINAERIDDVLVQKHLIIEKIEALAVIQQSI